MAFYIAATLGIAVYISIVILSSVRFGQNNQGQYSEKFSNYLATEDAQTTEEVSKLNQSLIGIPAPTLRLADMGEEVKKITTLAQSIPDFNMVGIVVDNEKKGRSVIAVPKDQAAVTQFTEKFRTFTPGGTVTVEPVDQTANGTTQLTFTLLGATP
jgi:hypothetical protein